MKYWGVGENDWRGLQLALKRIGKRIAFTSLHLAHTYSGRSGANHSSRRLGRALIVLSS